MPANGRWDLVRRLKVKQKMFLRFVGTLLTVRL